MANDHDIHRFEDDGGPPPPENDEPKTDTTNLPVLPYALAGPRVFGDINIRIALRPTDPEQLKFPAMAVTVDRDVLARVATKLHRGNIELDITDAFGKQRSLMVSPAELILLLQAAEKFVQELPA